MDWFANKFYNAVGDNFLSLLTSKNKIIYLQCLHEIYQLSNARLNRILDQDEVMQCVMRIVTEYHESIIDEESGKSIEDTPRQKTWYLTNNMEKCGWLRKEQKENSFDFNMFLTDNGVKLIRNTDVYLRSTVREYTGYLQQIYDLLSKRKGQPYSYSLMHKIVIETAFNLKESLQDLNTYVKDMVKELSRSMTYMDLFDNVNEFAEGGFLPQWTRLMEYDNRFIRLIENELNEIMTTPALFDPIVDDYMKETKTTKKEEAADTVYTQLNDVRGFISPSGGLFVQIVMDIRSRLHKYWMNIWSRFQLLEIRGTRNIRELSEQFLQIPNEKKETAENLFNIQRLEQINTASFRKRVGKRKKYTREPETVKRPSALEYADAKNEILSQYNDPNSRENIQAMLNKMLDGKGSIHTVDFDVKSKDRLVTSLQAIGYASELGFVVDVEEGYYETEEYAVRNVSIKKGMENDDA